MAEPSTDGPFKYTLSMKITNKDLKQKDFFRSDQIQFIGRTISGDMTKSWSTKGLGGCNLKIRMRVKYLKHKFRFELFHITKKKKGVK